LRGAPPPRQRDAATPPDFAFAIRHIAIAFAMFQPPRRFSHFFFFSRHIYCRISQVFFIDSFDFMIAAFHYAYAIFSCR